MSNVVTPPGAPESNGSFAPVPICATPECKNYVESSEDYCTDCLDKQAEQVHK